MKNKHLHFQMGGGMTSFNLHNVSNPPPNITQQSTAATIGKGALKGAATGASVGASIGSVVPIIGTAAGAGFGAQMGAIYGGAIGFLKGKKANREAEKRRKEYMKNLALMNEQNQYNSIMDFANREQRDTFYE